MIEFKDNLYRINPQVQLYSDVQQFESLVGRAQKCNSQTERRTLLRQAAELYQGEYVNDIDMAWADIRRSELRAQYVAVLAALGEIEFAKQNHVEALALYERAIALDTFQDTFHLQKLKCLAAMGNLNAARQYYLAYTEMLQSELHVAPGSELQEFYENL